DPYVTGECNGPGPGRGGRYCFDAIGVGERIGSGYRQVGEDADPGKGYLAAGGKDPGREGPFEGRPVFYSLAPTRANVKYGVRDEVECLDRVVAGDCTGSTELNRKRRVETGVGEQDAGRPAREYRLREAGLQRQPGSIPVPEWKTVPDCRQGSHGASEHFRGDRPDVEQGRLGGGAVSCQHDAHHY